MLKKDYAKSGKICVVTFVYPAEAAGHAHEVRLVGDFNDWNIAVSPMAKKADGSFEVVLKLETGREYYFRYLIDGARWDNDWNADKYVQSPYHDSDNSVVIL